MTKIIPFHPRRPPHPSAQDGWQASIGQSYNGIRVSTQFEAILREGVPFLVGEWLAEPRLNRLSRGEVTCQLEMRVMDVLLCLVNHAGEVVSHNDLLDAVWQTEFVSDNAIKNRIFELRKALGDDAHNPRYIETIPKRGYRLIAQVDPVTSSAEPGAPFPEIPLRGESERNPYPGLAAFTEADADLFFGREAEVASLWRRITSRRLLAVIGPSGIGKSSLLRAGVAPRAPPGWRVVVFTPGENPAISLARSLAPDHVSDPQAVARLVGFTDPDTALGGVARWRGKFEEAVLIVDQFEELFTLNAPEVQTSFIALLRRLVDAADVHVVLAMRDDYLHRCQPFEQIAPIFRDVTPLGPPSSEGLRRALQEPAARQFYRFDSELLVDRIIAAVEGERGALPLMAFAVNRLWEERDRDERLLTEEAYEHIGGVAGALAKHADATLERIGPERRPIVREIFRNLVTAEGTRAVREVDELLSVFPEDQRETAEQVLRQLIDARLLTGYRDQADGERPTRRVEIIHESLLTSWPRLVRWQTQDADSARLRDELRQAARLWDDHERANDYLWTGRAFREFAVWHEGYPGGLTDVEKDFASAAASHAQRRNRRRRITVASAFVILLGALGIVAVSRQQAVSEAKRAEAAKLLALGQLRLEDYPTATLAHAIASLDLADTAEARRIALQALWVGPTAFVINGAASYTTEFTPDGEWLVQSIERGDQKQVGIVAKDGSRTDFDQVFSTPMVATIMNPEGSVLFSKPQLVSGSPQRVLLWSIPDGRKLADVRIEPPAYVWARAGWNRDRCLAVVGENDWANIFAINFDGTHERLGRVRPSTDIDERTGRWLAFVSDQTVSICEIGDHSLSAPRLLGRHEGSGHHIAFDADGRFVVTSSSDGQIKIWDPTGAAPPMAFQGPPGARALNLFGNEPRLAVRTTEGDADTIYVYAFRGGDARLLRTIERGRPGNNGMWRQVFGWDSAGLRMAKNGPDQWTRVWSLSAPAAAEPLILKRGEVGFDWRHSFHPGGGWVATADGSGLMVWPLTEPQPSVISSHQKAVWSVAFGPGGQWCAFGNEDGIVRLVPLAGEVPAEGGVLFQGSSPVRSLAASPDGTTILAGGNQWGTMEIPLDGRPAFAVGDLWGGTGAAYSRDGQLVAVAGRTEGNRYALQILTADAQKQTTSIEPGGFVMSVDPRFLNDGRIVYARDSGLYALDPATGTSDVVFEGKCWGFAVSENGRKIAVLELSELSWAASGHAVLLDLDAGTQARLNNHGHKVSAIAMDAAGTMIVTGDKDGVVRVGPTDGSEPHLLLGHESRILSVDIDPLGRWIASGGQDGTVRIWPMPDLTKPPLHTLPHDELIAKLKSLTNLRVVRDDDSPTGWILTQDPFPGWETAPSW